MNEERNVLKIVASRLNAAGIPYMVSGSIAANVYTTPRMTRDIDIVVALQPDDAERLFGLFRGDFYVDLDSVKQAARLRSLFNIIHQQGIVKVDFIVRKDTEYRKTEFERRRTVDLEGTDVSIVSPEDLILSKLQWARESRSELQLRDVRNLLTTVGNLDRGYIERWIARLNLDEIYREATR